MEKIKITPKFFFITLGTLITLITSVFSFINLANGLINQVFVDILSDSYRYGYFDYEYTSIRSAVATLIIFFPIYLILENKWSKLSKKENSKWDVIIRKWSLYLIIFIATLTLVINLAILVKYFVGGELTNRFIFKTITTILIVCLSGFYYLRELNNKLTYKKIFFITSTILFIAIIIFTFNVIGLPKDQRLLRLDQRRLNDLNSLKHDIVSYWQQTKSLPENLTDLNSLYSGYRIIQDPEFQTGKMYEYNILSQDDLVFELCAEFSKDMSKSLRDMNISPYMATIEKDSAVYLSGKEIQLYESGRQCFETKINQNLIKN